MNKVITTVLATLIRALVVMIGIAEVECDRHSYSRRN